MFEAKYFAKNFMKKRIRLSDSFCYGKLIRFTLPMIATTVLVSTFAAVDGLFVANFVGKTQFAAINFVMPMLNILAAFGYMFGAGGGALIAKTLGEGDRKRANGLFSAFVYLSLAFGFVASAFGFALMRPLLSSFGAEGRLLTDSLLYGRVFILALPFWTLLYVFQLFFRYRRKTEARFLDERRRRGNERRFGRALYRRFRLGARRSGGGFGVGANGRRSFAVDLFRAQKRQSFETDSSDLRSRFRRQMLY